jgi:uncharacterized protein with FMN-binding domain
MAKLLRGVLALFLVAFLSACPSDTSDSTNEPSGGGRVVAPVIKMDPPRSFNSEAISISFTSTTPDAEFYYTLDGSTPSANTTKYTGPFSLAPDNANIKDTPYPGSIQVRVIGTKAGMDNSTIKSQNFQIFSKELIKDAGGTEITGTATGIGKGGYHSADQKALVTVTVTKGVITAAYENGYDGTASHTPDYWASATAHADKFLATMNSCEFDTVTGASRSSAAIKDGLKEAMSKILSD